MIEYLLLMLAGAQGAEPVALPEPPKERLICRYDAPVRWSIYRRKMCLTTSEWEQRAKGGAEASRTILNDYLGNTNCLSDGICTSF